ncbi:hypothetical protein Mapa_017245 [Marchantia paleacea]|nr:hypothetical protein Mapa_017245 [Marchantia paleacea]
MQFPIAEGLLRPVFPLLYAYKGFPYLNFIAFFSLYLLVVRNSSFSRYVRFNAMQAVVLDVLLILPTLVERTFGSRSGIGLQLLIISYNTVFLFWSVASCSESFLAFSAKRRDFPSLLMQQINKLRAN